MNFRKLLLVAGLLNATYVGAQYNAIQNNKWAVGDFYGLDFTNPASPAVFTTAMDNGEGQASICDASGDLLFYTNGSTVWNKNGTVMPDGTNLTGTGTAATISTTQGALIVPMPDSAHKYYLFSLTAVTNCKLFCNVIDMNLDGGLGNVDIGFSLRLSTLRSGLTEKMTAVPGDNNDIWVMVHKESSDSFLAYHITPSGLDLNPVGSAAGTFSGNFYQQGVMKFSPNRTRILTCNFRATNPTSAGLEVFDFDPATGILSNGIVLDNNSYYGGTFSADNTKIYAETTNTMNSGTVFQFDLSDPTPSGTKMLLGPSGQYTDMKLGPDDKIYFGALIGSPGWSNYKYLGRINSPNTAGTACGFQDSVTSLYFPHPTSTTQGRIQQGMPNDIAIPIANPLSLKRLDFSAKANSNNVNVSWKAEGEERVATYTLERSFDGRSYNAIYAATPFGNYTFIDINALSEDIHIYYRLRISEKDNRQSYSRVVHVFGKKDETNITIFPNPANDRIYFSGTNLVSISIQDASGRNLIQQQNVRGVNVSSLPLGLYYITIKDDVEQRVYRKRFVKSTR